MSALENKLQKHERHFSDVIELEKQEALLVYQDIDNENFGVNPQNIHHLTIFKNRV